MNANKKEKIGILGGTFDPVHSGHLILAQELKETLGLQKVIFVPSATPPHKEGFYLSPARDRMMMTQIAIQDNPDFSLCDLEIKREGESYTIDTIKELKKLYPQQELYLLLGSDVLEELSSWKEPDKIFREVKVAIAIRPGFDTIDKRNEYVKKAKLIPISGLNISSTEIREKVKSGKSIRYLVPPEVEEFIRAKNIYKR
ncbi:MAG: nicotinate-nucleotide adenylyltransferase [candidate division Zixibacteria bacterium]|nr:nicotinate-nucleotide adenylyltransferase [candidate division Zixibacteria bacterium]